MQPALVVAEQVFRHKENNIVTYCTVPLSKHRDFFIFIDICLPLLIVKLQQTK